MMPRLPAEVAAMLLLAPSVSWSPQKFKYSFKDPGGLTKYTEQHASIEEISSRVLEDLGINREMF